MKIIIVGGGVAGVQAALTLKQLMNGKDIEITIIDKRKRIGFAPCALPLLLKGDIDDKDIWVYPQIEEEIKVVHEKVERIDAKKRIVKTEQEEYNYDYLILATGAKPRNLGGITINNPDDIKKIKELNPQEVVIIGAGPIGLEIAEALRKKNVNVTVIEAMNHVLPTFLDRDMAKIVEEELKNMGIRIIYGKANIIEGKEVKIGDIELNPDLVISAIGTAPRLDLAINAGLKTNKGIIVNQFMLTSNKYIYAIGDVIEYYDFLGRKTLSAFATNAVQEAIVAARHIAKRVGIKLKVTPMHPLRFPRVIKIGDLVIGGVGFKEEVGDHSVKISTKIYPKEIKNDEKIIIKLTSKNSKNRNVIIGGQVIGRRNVLPRIELMTSMMGKEVEEAMLTETAYNPVLNTTIDPVVKAAYFLERRIRNS